ncbi:MAG: hypothetical protein CFE21_16075 [Bacteroidetes bacterium B1(2017)]|nr:MAG: hypothetical protein CFE21_16075 [Bacteroidetes bacterium B1(2017)]
MNQIIARAFRPLIKKNESNNSKGLQALELKKMNQIIARAFRPLIKKYESNNSKGLQALDDLMIRNPAGL